MILRQSTALAVSFGPFVSPTDGVTLQTGLVSAIDHGTTGIMLSKNGGALTIRHATVTASTYDAYGNYIVTLDTTDTNTVGKLRMQFAAAASCLPVWIDFTVVEEAVYDALFAASAAGYGTAQTGDTYALANGSSGFVAIKAILPASGTIPNTTTVVPADIKKVNGTTVQGAGTSGSPWGP